MGTSFTYPYNVISTKFNVTPFYSFETLYCSRNVQGYTEAFVSQCFWILIVFETMCAIIKTVDVQYVGCLAIYI